MATKKVDKAPRRNPWEPPGYDDADVTAIKALTAGTANEQQQVRAIRYIVESLCGAYDLEWRPGSDGERESSFAAGKRWVGLQIIHLTKVEARRITNERE